MLASTSGDRKAKLWDTKTGQFLDTLNGHSYIMFSASFNADGTLLATGSIEDESPKLWDTRTASLTAPIPDLSVYKLSVYKYETLTDVMFSPDGQTLATANFMQA